MSEIDNAISRLVGYGLASGLIEDEDITYSINSILKELKKDDYSGSASETIAYAITLSKERIADGRELEETLKVLTDYAVQKSLIEDSIAYRDLFDTALMGSMVDRPSHLIRKFWALYEKDPKEATDWYYDFSQNTDYIRRYRISKDLRWKTDTAYGELDITINLSKPEKDPKAIAAAKNAAQTAYPKCQLCVENEGYAGRIDHPARENHRVIPIKINNSKWYFQYSPYVYYQEHCIAFNGQHQPMKIDRAAFEKLLDFVTIFPHYFIGSNADLPIVGGSILSHDHFQGGHYTFAMEKAEILRSFEVEGYEEVKAGVVKWPLSCIRLSSKNRKSLADLAEKILSCWWEYTDEEAFIYAYTEGEPHNTITPIARRKGEAYELDLVLRNNITTQEHPLGLYHPHAKLHHIKKENIGLIEVMGLAVLPSRLKKEMAELKEAILKGENFRMNPSIEKHADWAEEILEKYDTISPDNIDEILQKEIGLVFMQVLEDAGVYKQTEEGQAAFDRFLERVKSHG
jgi:UDPglucose--hexose-1-phosphate uridylyltransferase